MKYKILIVEDEEDIANLIKYNLIEEGYDADVCSDGLAAIDYVKEKTPDLMLLDIMLPKLNGINVVKILKQNNYTFPILFVTAKSTEIDKILGFEIGGDDYITKPFSIPELKARVKAFLRRHFETEPKNKDILKGGDIILDKIKHSVTLGNKAIELRPKEFAILELLLENKGRAFSRDIISQRIWGESEYVDDGTIDVHIRRLRVKIDDDCSEEQKHIITLRGIGYKFNDQI